jgi:hypothetical protein
VLKDEQNPKGMPIDHMGAALDQACIETGRKIDILGLDSCFMGNAETAYAVKNSVKYLVGSEEASVAENWDYDQITRLINEGSDRHNLPVNDVLNIMMDSQNNKYLITSSVIDCQKMPNFAEYMKNFAKKLLNTTTDKAIIKEAFNRSQHFGLTDPNTDSGGLNQMRDLISITKNIIDNKYIGDKALKQAAYDLCCFLDEKVVVGEMHRKSPAYEQSEGISVYAPTTGAENYIHNYSLLSFAKDTGWDRVIEMYSSK